MTLENTNMENYIFTDEQSTKMLLWDYYQGILSAYGDLRLRPGKNIHMSPIVLAKFTKYFHRFYVMIKSYIDNIYNKAEAEDKKLLDKIKGFYSHTEKFTFNDVLLIVSFCEKFMYDSGLTRIVKIKDNTKISEKVRGKL